MADPAARSISILLVHPGFGGGSFWNYQAACDLIGAKYPAPPLGLITVAAMLPKHWTVRLVDCNTRPLSDADILAADYVFSGGMLPQQRSILELCARCRALGVPIVLGGPDVTSSPPVYAAAADFLVLGEAEGAIDGLIAAIERSERSGRFEAPKFTIDITRTPMPRFDLLNFDDYVHVNVQYSRGCPFLCEFCDIIELYGRKPRTKETNQILGELQRLYDLGYRGHVDFVDDNLIGNKKAVKAFLPDLIAWQKARGYPFDFSTEASLNIADDDEFLGMMRDANFFALFVGIESPDPDVLAMAQKKQNTRRDIAAGVHKLYAVGIFVIAGFIVGFDNEKDRMADALLDLIDEASIPMSMVGLLYALPNTQLTRRLAKEGRLFDDNEFQLADGGIDQCVQGLNFETLRPREDVLADYRSVVDAIYDPAAFFARVRKTADMLDMSGVNGKPHLTMLRKEIVTMSRLLWNITVKSPMLRRHLWPLMIHVLRTNPGALRYVLVMTALFAHLGPFSRDVVREIDKRIEKARLAPPPPAETVPALSVA